MVKSKVMNYSSMEFVKNAFKNEQKKNTELKEEINYGKVGMSSMWIRS